MNAATDDNVDDGEIRKFDALASRWWDPEGEFKPLHRLNPLRAGYVTGRAAVDGQPVLDVGCGGGLLTEALAQAGGEVTGIDMAPAPLQVAKLHQHKSGLDSIRYLETHAEALAEQETGRYAVVTCMEVIEHVPDPQSLITACAALTRPGGDVFFSTLNRNLKAFMLAIVGAEYVLNMLPKGTHEYSNFIRPSELRRWARAADLEFADITGLTYHPISGEFSLGSDVDVNYLMHFRKPA
ncbi:MAG: bifunctional 2-polyprenyl-6-hydroxyphenol methylase/3-demethylubiquinol 3-O-methyltransferase UbiG [Gammaproteobacteria bacterium]|nr:bifunctional 2-polyprenyl-6-hydroxyphenol methylase/3-demethylubiquinol 3-O-methyltransferase UbiG [Gammaproteobacteria bacterium]